MSIGVNIKLIFGHEITKGWELINTDIAINGDSVITLRGKPEVIRSPKTHCKQIFRGENLLKLEDKK